MNRITISLPSVLADILAREARRLGTSVSDVVRRAVSAQLAGTGGAAKRLPFESLGRSGRRHTARDADEILAREWGRDRAR
jgi:Arc/MetJ-type ribon-helix-helix transcriptional regulator